MDVGAQPLSRLRGIALPPDAARRLALANAAALFVIVATGATVRLTGSGLGCEHWPGCQPHHFEPRSFHSYIEFGNRVVAFLTILVTLDTGIGARVKSAILGAPTNQEALTAQKATDAISVTLIKEIEKLAKGTVSPDEKIGVDIIRRSLEEPLRQIAENAGFEGSVEVNRVKNAKPCSLRAASCPRPSVGWLRRAT